MTSIADRPIDWGTFINSALRILLKFFLVVLKLKFILLCTKSMNNVFNHMIVEKGKVVINYVYRTFSILPAF